MGHLQIEPAGCPARISASLLTRNHTSNRRRPLPTREHSPNRLPLFRQGRKSARASALRPTFLDSPIQCEKSGLVNRIVIDKTGLTGRYDFRLDLIPYMTSDTDGKDGAKADIMSILFAGFNDQLGLKLEAGKESVDLLVVDAVNKTPTEN
jgi:uncharacterized protein (TIGR03435 family)